MFLYNAFKLNIHSEFFLPELIKGRDKADIYIKKGRINLPKLQPTSIQRKGIEALFGGNSNEAYIRWPSVATLLAKNGNTLIVDSDSDDIDPQVLNLYILSEALGLILYQRGLFLLHASAVKIGEQVVVFSGNPGAGKSTTAAAFAKLGYTVLADDMVAIELDNTGRAMVYPAFPQIKIWPPTVKGLGFDDSTLLSLFYGSKKRVIQQKKGFPVEPFPLAHIMILENGESLNITKIQGMKAFFMLARFFPLPSNLLQGKESEEHFQKCINVLTQASVWKVDNPKEFRLLKELVCWVEKNISMPQKSVWIT